MVSKQLIKDNFADIYIDECPSCEKGINPDILHIDSEEFDGTYYVSALCKCPVCNTSFLAKYDYEGIFDPLGYPKYMNPVNYYPSKKTKITTFDERIDKLSPLFVEHYNQGEIAENHTNCDVSGIVFRRSFEFLIRDFVIKLIPEKKEEILADNSLSNIIKNRLPDKYGIKEIRDIAIRTWWLGNDYAHFTKHYNDKDINDLKECIDITCSYIVLYLKYNHQVDSIVEKKKKNVKDIDKKKHKE